MEEPPSDEKMNAELRFLAYKFLDPPIQPS